MKTPHLSRRNALRAAGFTLGLPWLTSLQPRAVRAATPPPRMVFFYVPNGMNMDGWRPSQTGAGYALSPTLAPLAPVKDRCLVLSGIANEPASRDRNGDHTNGTAAFLTCTQPNKSRVQLAASVDQVAAAAIGRTDFPSLQLGTGAPSSSHCDGYPCPYANNISWANATTPLSKTTSPQALFDRLFAGADPAASEKERLKRRAYRKSVLDAVMDDLTSLQRRLGKTDADKLDEYLTGLHDVEKRLAAATDEVKGCQSPARPAAPPMPFADSLKLLIDLTVMAFQCDRTRIVSLMLHAAQSDPSYEFLGVSGGHHSISHHGRNAANLNKLLVIDKWEVAQLAYLLGKLKAAPEGESDLLAHSVVFFSSDISDGDQHLHTDLPVVLAGEGGGKITSGRHLKVPAGTQMADLYLTMLRHAGVEATSFANSKSLLNLG